MLLEKKSISNHISSKAIILLILFIGLSLPGYAQFEDISFQFGLVTTSIMGDSPNKDLLIENSDKSDVIGGSFDGQHVGFGARLVLGLDKKGRFKIPVGIDYEYYSARERIPIYRNASTKIKHNTNIATGIIGINYSFYKFPFANVRAYAGFEIRAAYVSQGDISYTLIYENYDEINENTYGTKEGTIRLGPALRLGFEGDISRPVFIDASVGFGVMNMFGRDDSRGELLTPTHYFENQESLVYNMHISLMLKYKFNL